LQEVGSEFAVRKYTTSPPGCEIDENLYGMFILSPCFDFAKIRKERRMAGTVQRHGFSLRHELVILTQNIGRSIQVFETGVGDRWVKLQM
jgi:NDP-sugar pyrophosphorylase family protein